MNAEVEVRTAHIAVVFINKHKRCLDPLARYFIWQIEAARSRFPIYPGGQLCSMHESAEDAEACLCDKRGTRVIMFVSDTDMKKAKRLAKSGQRTVIFVSREEWDRLMREKEEGKANVPRELHIFWRGLTVTPEWLAEVLA